MATPVSVHNSELHLSLARLGLKFRLRLRLRLRLRRTRLLGDRNERGGREKQRVGSGLGPWVAIGSMAHIEAEPVVPAGVHG